MIYLDYSIDLQERITPEKYPVQPTEKVVLTFGRQEQIMMNLVSERKDLGALFSEIIVWEAVVYQASDFSVLCKTLNEGIDVSGLDEGKISFRINTKTENFLRAVRKQGVHGFLELRGFNSSDELIQCMKIRILGQYASDPHGAVPEEIYDDIATMNWVREYLSGGALDHFVTQENFEKTLNNALPGCFKITDSKSDTISLIHNTVVKHDIIADGTISFDTDGLPEDGCICMELWLSMSAEVVSFTISGVTWLEEPAFDAANTLYAVVIRWDGTQILGNIAYTKEII